MNMMNVAVDHVEGPTDGEDSIEVSNNIKGLRPLPPTPGRERYLRHPEAS